MNKEQNNLIWSIIGIIIISAALLFGLTFFYNTADAPADTSDDPSSKPTGGEQSFRTKTSNNTEQPTSVSTTLTPEQEIIASAALYQNEVIHRGDIEEVREVMIKTMTEEAGVKYLRQANETTIQFGIDVYLQAIPEPITRELLEDPNTTWKIEENKARIESPQWVSFLEIHKIDGEWQPQQQ